MSLILLFTSLEDFCRYNVTNLMHQYFQREVIRNIKSFVLRIKPFPHIGCNAVTGKIGGSRNYVSK